MSQSFIATLEPAPAAFAEARVVNLIGEEAINQPSRFVIELDIPGYNDGGSGLSDLLQREVGIKMRWIDDSGEPAAFENVLVRAGVITEVSYLGVMTRGESRLRIVVCDRLALTGIGQRTRAHVEKSQADIVNDIADRVQATVEITSGMIHPRIVQWQETDLAFVTRLMADHSGFFYTRPGAAAGDQKIIFGGNPSAYGSAGDALDAHYISPTESGGHHGVRDFMRREGLVAETITHSEHVSTNSDFQHTVERPSSLPAQAKYAATDFIHRIPTVPQWMGAATGLAKAQVGNRLIFSGASAYASLHAGRCLKLAVDWPEADEQYFVLSVQHELTRSATGVAYINHFTAVPYTAQWHPWPLPTHPTVAGMRLAIVTANDVVAGDASDEGSSLEQGVYEVRFPSERDWDGTELIQRARFAQPAAGNDRGLHIPPEVGDEVVVVHHNGDPDRPVIVGTLYSTNAVGPQVKVSGGTTISSVLRSRTGHELRFDDESGSEKMSLTSGTGDHGLVWDDAGKKMALATEGDLTESVKGDHSSKVVGTQSIEVTGDQSTKISANRSANISADDQATVTGSWSVTATGKAGLTSSASIALGAPSITITGDASIALKVGASSITIDAGSISMSSPKISISGAMITVAADAKAAVSAPMVEISGTGQAKLSGGTIQVSASGPLQLLGAMITNNG